MVNSCKKIYARAVAPSCALAPGECDIFEFHRSGTQLELGIQRNLARTAETIRITFERYFTLFVTDEGDLTRYWGSDMFKGHGHIFEILDGGLLWNESQYPGLLTVTAAMPNVREWFVRTTGECITVISDTEPQIRVVVGDEAP
ncbi:MAG: hypothetical protein P4L70_09915 [Parasulfuritortus sp.]|nr:hypothetical protein [Parasulfuritortus sp.]